MSFNYDDWNQWTIKSHNIDFNFKLQGEGKGERKLAAEFSTEPKGQNYSYDLIINREECEIKQLDNANSHRIGVEVSKDYSEIKRNALTIIQGFTNLKNEAAIKHYSTIINMLITPVGRNKTSILEGFQKNELSESNLETTEKFIDDLISEEMSKKFNRKILYSSIDGEIYEYDHRRAYRKINVENIPFKDKIEFFDRTEDFFWLMATDDSIESISYFREKRLSERLNTLVRKPFFKTRLVIVDEKLGYYPVNDLSVISCNRITQGNPRIKIELTQD